jgi:hypothetical protein
VVRGDLGDLCLTPVRHRLDPLAHLPMEVAALRPRQARVDDVLGEGVLEGELAHPFDR